MDPGRPGSRSRGGWMQTRDITPTPWCIATRAAATRWRPSTNRLGTASSLYSYRRLQLSGIQNIHCTCVHIHCSSSEACQPSQDAVPRANVVDRVMYMACSRVRDAAHVSGAAYSFAENITRRLQSALQSAHRLLYLARSRFDTCPRPFDQLPPLVSPSRQRDDDHHRWALPCLWRSVPESEGS